MRGFTLVEGLIAMFFTFMIALFVAGMLTFFGIYNRDNFLRTCLVQAAGSAIEACRGGAPVPKNMNCTIGDRTVEVSVSMKAVCNVINDYCEEVTAIARAEGKEFSLSDVVCNFRR